MLDLRQTPLRQLILRHMNRRAEARKARLGKAADVRINPALIGVGMRIAQWKRSRRDPDMGAA